MYPTINISVKDVLRIVGGLCLVGGLVLILVGLPEGPLASHRYDLEVILLGVAAMITAILWLAAARVIDLLEQIAARK
jgi:hypothetical protein